MSTLSTTFGPDDATAESRALPPPGRGTSRCLLVLEGAAPQVAVLPEGGTVSIGRIRDRTIVIDEPSVSRHHADLIIVPHGPEIAIVDAGSANGTFIRGERLKPGRAYPLPYGAALRLGTVTLMLHAHAEAAAAATGAPPPVAALAPARGDMFGQVKATVADIERRCILEALEECGGNQKRAALRLGVSRRTLLKRLDEYAIARPRKLVE